MFRQIKFYLIIGAIIGTGLLGWKGRGWYEDSKDVKAIVKLDNQDTKKVETVIKWREKEKVVYRDKIKYIKLAKDPTGCADTKLTDMGFGLHNRSQ